jgi:hypothetical protein
MTELERIEERLRTERAEVTAVEMDRIKMRAMARATAAARKGHGMFRSRNFAALLAVLVMGVGTGGVIANNGNGGDNGSAAKGEYKPGKGCGDKNHQHARSDECKKDNGSHAQGSHSSHKNAGSHGDD